MKRLKSATRKQHVIEQFIRIALKKPYTDITREELADSPGVSRGIIWKHFKNMKKLQKAVLKEAIRRNIPQIVALGIARKDVLIHTAPNNVKRDAVDYLANL